MDIDEEIIQVENKILKGERLDRDERKWCAFGEVGEYVDEIEGDDHRWTREMQTIFKIGEQYYAINWMSGLTEMQENEYWNDPYKVERKEEIVTKTVVKYVAMEE